MAQRSSPAKKKTAKRVPPRTSTDARRQLDRATTALRRLQKADAERGWRIGRQLARIAQLQLHRARGFTRVDEYAAKTLGLSSVRTFQYMRVAEAFGEELVDAHGVEKLYRALQGITRGTPNGPKARGKTLRGRASDVLDDAAAAAAMAASAALETALGRVHSAGASVSLRRSDRAGLLVDVRGVPLALARQAFAALGKSLK